jgi:hypothetical protein
VGSIKKVWVAFICSLYSVRSLSEEEYELLGFLAEAEKIYEIHGIIDWVNEPFQGHKTYDAFLIFLKNG